MNNFFEIKGLINFLKKNKNIFLVTFLLTLSIVVFLFWYSNASNEKQKEEVIDSYSISFLIENNQGMIWNNFNNIKFVIIEELLKYNSSYDKKNLEDAVKIDYDHETGVMQLIVSNKNSIDGKTICNYIYNSFVDKKNSYFQNKVVYLFGNGAEKYKNLKDTKKNPFRFSLKLGLILLFLIIFLTVVIGTFFSVLFERKNKCISSEFTLVNDFNLINISKLGYFNTTESVRVVENLMNEFSYWSKLIIIENDELRKQIKINLKDKNSKVIGDLSENRENLEKVEKIYLIIEKDRTSKRWFAIQKELAKGLEVDIQCIII